MTGHDAEHGVSSSPQEEPATYAFLNHSTDTLVNKLPPEVDNKPLARQKRKRTSPEDQAVLEAAYLRDPKPDKDARLRLVEQIALGEKEVQIWFQNRRQTSRRKSRPLLPHEIAQFQLSRYGTANFGSEDNDAQLSDEHVDAVSAGRSTEDSDDSVEMRNSSQIELVASQKSTLPSLLNLSQDSSTGSLANRRSLPSLSQVLKGLDHKHTTIDRQSLRKSASFVRLSMTSEGAAKVVTKDSVTPSPPRPVDIQEAAVHERELSPSRRPEPARQSSLKRSASGRSRDSRAWEFWCDKDCRSELEEKAEKDGKGSAADAIGLMRAANTRKALQPIAYKPNAALAQHQSWIARHMKPDVRRPDLQRSQTSEGRLQHANNHVKRKRFTRPGALDSSMSVYIPDNESDKENWSPGGAHERGDSHYAGKSRTFAGKADAENFAPEDDPEVAAFMKVGRKAQRVPRNEELDCVQGLLSLSQGNWAA